MERSSFAILFFIRDSRIKKDGTATIEVVLTINGERCAFSTGKKVKASNWDKTRQQVRGKDGETKSLNNFIKAVRAKLYEKEAELMDKGFVVTAELLRDAYFDKVDALKEKTPPASEGDKVFKLDRKKIYALSILLGAGYEIGLLGINRKVNKNALAKKIQSIKTSKGLISPVLVVTAKRCIELGLEVYVKGKKVNADASNLDKILVIIDGQHRIQAINAINNKRKEGEELLDAYVYLPLNENIDIKTLLRETNVATQPWKGGDYLVSILMSDDENINKDMISWVHTISGKCGDTAAWLWATMDKSRVYSKAKLIEASKKPEVLKDVANTLYFKEGKALYEKATVTLSEDLTKLKVVPTWFIDKKAELIQADYKMSKAMGMLLDFIDSLAPIEVNHIKGLKKDENFSKDAKIKKALDELWAEKNKGNSKKATNDSKTSDKK